MRHWALRLQSRDRLEFFFVFINETFSTLFRLKNFCGSIADAVQSKTNKIHIRYFADAPAINSSFNILYTAYREKGNKGRPGHTSRGFMCSLESNLLPFSLTFLFAPFCAFHRQWIKNSHNRSADCREDEYDCEDQTCIKDNLRCNGNVNCRFRWDEDVEKCKVSVGCPRLSTLHLIAFLSLPCPE